MKKITRPEAYALMTENELEKIENRLQIGFDLKGDKDMTHQYFIDDQQNLFCEICYDNVHVVSIQVNESNLIEGDHSPLRR